MSKILITGSTGFIGSCLAKKLQGHELKGTGIVDEQDTDVPILYWEDAGDVAAIFHMSANNKTQSKDEAAMMEANYYFSIRLFEYYYTKGCRKFFWASSGAAKDGLTYYAKSKLMFEEWADKWSKDKDISCVGFRFSNVWDLSGAESHKGKRASMVYQIYNHLLYLNDKPLILFNGNPTRDFIHVDDVVSCLINAIDVKTKGIFNLGSGVSTPISDVVEYCKKLLKVDAIINYIDCPFQDTYQFKTEMDISKTQETFNWNPTIFIV